MTNQEKIHLIEKTIGMDADTLTPETELKNLEMWDSVGKLFFMSEVKKTFGKDLQPAEVRGLATVADMMAAMDI